MTPKTGFIKNALKAFKSILKEVERGSSEYDVRYRFVKYFLEEVLGYEPRYIKWEKKRADLTITDENNFAVIKIETKRPSENIDKTRYEEQAFKYEEETTRFIGLTNFKQFRLWELKKTGKELKVDLDIDRIFSQGISIEKLSIKEKSQILFLNRLTKESLFSPSKYEEFNETYARIDITKDIGFRKLLDRLNFIANNLLLGYTLRAFGEYKEGYSKYQNELKELSEISKNEKNGYMLAKAKQKIEERYSKYKTFGGYYLWKEYSGKENVSDDDAKEIFCKESIYVLLNKLLFIRICEDKQLLEKNISNGGIEELRTMLKKRFDEDVINRELLEIAFKSARTLYEHFYETGILDWFRTGDGELNELLNRVLWILNQFDFTHVDRDILGNLYEKYLPSGERKRLGEFYTPTEVIDYILTSVGYTYSHDIEIKDLLDPACGSGGFLVRATRRLISRYLMKFRKTDKRELRNPKNWKEIVDRLSSEEAKIILEAIQEHIYGLDINPFACHIAEMNMLFQVIDLYKKTKEKYSDFKLKRFKIYQTESLELPRQKNITDFGNHLKFLQEREEIDAIKNKKFDFVVGNPPYVRVQTLDYKSREIYKKEYKSAYKQFDLYVLFIERGIDWLKDNAFLGYITSNKFIKREYGKEIRKILLDQGRLLQLVDLTQIKIFKEATNDPVIIIFRKTRKPTVLKYIEISNYRHNILNSIFYHGNKNDYSDRDIKIVNVTNEELIKNNWQIVKKEKQKIIHKINQKGTLLKNYAQIHEGLITGADDVFVVNEKIVDSLRLEKQLLKPVLKGKDIRRYSALLLKLFLIFPYKIANGKVRLIQEGKLKTYVNIYKYLLSHKHKLSKRYCVKTKGYAWYSYHDFANPVWFETVKIVTPDISETNNFSIDTGINVFDKKQFYYLTHSCYCINLNNKDYKDNLFFLGILNSRLVEFFLKKISVKLGKRGYRYITQYLEQIPIKLPSTPEEKKIASQIIKKVDEILKVYKSQFIDINSVLKADETEKLSNLPKVNFNISNNTKFEYVRTKGNRVYINSVDFVEIRDRKVKAFVELYLSFNIERFTKSRDVKNLILNIPIPRSEKTLMYILNTYKQDQKLIKEKIDRLEAEINDLVYQLYEITEQEKRIIEMGL